MFLTSVNVAMSLMINVVWNWIENTFVLMCMCTLFVVICIDYVSCFVWWSTILFLALLSGLALVLALTQLT